MVCDSLQAQLEKAKAEYEERISAVRNEAEQLQAQLSESEKGKAELQRQLDAAQRQAEDQRQQAVQREARMQVRGGVLCLLDEPARRAEHLRLWLLVSRHSWRTRTRTSAG